MIVHFLVRTESISVTEVSKIVNCSEVCFNSHFTLIVYLLYILVLVPTRQYINLLRHVLQEYTSRITLIPCTCFLMKVSLKVLFAHKLQNGRAFLIPTFIVYLSQLLTIMQTFCSRYMHILVCITWLSSQKIWLQLVCTYDSASLVMFLIYFCSREFDMACKYNWLHSASFCLSSYTLMYYTYITFCWRR